MACGVEQKCSERYTTLVRVYIIAAGVALTACAAMLVVVYGAIAIILPSVSAAAVLWAAVSLPEMYTSRLVYIRHRDWLMVQRGLLWHRSILLPRRQIQYVRLRRGPVERLFGLSSLVFMTSGGRVRVCGLEPQDAERLRRLMERG